MNKGDRHAAFAHAAGYALDRVMAHIAGAEHSRQAGLQRKRFALEFPGREIAPGADVAVRIPLQFSGSQEVLASAPIITNRASAS